MKTFKDLEFKINPKSPYFNTHATMKFNNGYGVIVINGHGAYCGKNTYEVAVLYNDELTYDTHITNDALSCQTEQDVTKVMKQIQQLNN